MNIFYLSHDPVQCAKWHCDKHVVKMILEYAQLMCTAHHLTGTGTKCMYKCTHQNHPCAVWGRESANHYVYLFDLWYELTREYKRRYGKFHKTATLFDDLLPTPMIPIAGFTAPPQCMPEEYKQGSGINDTIAAYRMYYKHGKADILSYRKNKPRWLDESAAD